MGDFFKALLSLVVGVVVLVASYIGWLLYMPVSETDVSARISNACMIGQVMTSGRSHYTSCSCFIEGLDINEENVAEFSRQAEVLRQIAVVQYTAYWSGTYDVKAVSPEIAAISRQAAPLVDKLQKVDRACKVRAS
jgi:sensor domain CHASE-containing protein